MALRRRLEGVAAVRISQEQQTAEVVFGGGAHAFSPGAVRAAIKEADVDVMHFEIDACGAFETTGDTEWFTAGPNRFAVSLEVPRPMIDHCLSAVLDDAVVPARLQQLRKLPARTP